QRLCALRSCCWSPLSDTSVPWCFFSSNHGYRMQGLQRNLTNIEATLTRLPSPSLFGKDIDSLRFTLDCQTVNRFRFKVTFDLNSLRFEVPHEHVRPS
ncbi:SUIS protein, partial [Rhinopomastus cyanomelas]|nr:SUIS protein [Rhinopomastus cyanomelas]